MRRAVVGLLLAACASAPGDALREPGLLFADVTDDSPDLARAIATRNNVWDSIDIYSGGVAFTDLTGDGAADLVLARTATTDRDRQGLVFLENTGQRFVDRTRERALIDRSLTTGVAVFDFDGDGRDDLFVGTDREGDRLYRQRADGTFEDVASAAGVRGRDRRTRSIALLDADADGWLDLYLAVWDGAGPLGHYGGATSWRAANVLYRNRGDGTFEDVTARARADCDGRSTLGVAAGDLDGDDDVDLYVANDFFDDCLLANNGDGTFTDVSRSAGVGPHAINGMGAAFGDADADGDLDIVVTDDERPDASTGNAFYFNEGGLRFRSAALAIGVDGVTSARQAIAIYWGAGFRDFDLDGALELHVAQQEVGPDHLFVWRGDRYERAAIDALSASADNRGSAYADFDRDGAVDLVTLSRGGPPRLLHNRGGAGARSVRIELLGPVGNRRAIGASVWIEACGRRLLRHVEGTTGYLSASESILTVGLDRCAGPIAIEARLPGGRSMRIPFVDQSNIVIDFNSN